jgi:gluconate 2-dehydrogenase gamma chain
MAFDGNAPRCNRRDFLAAGALAGAALATGCRNSGYEFLTDAEAATLTALCDQIIPADGYPSASQAGVLTYIDRQLTRHYARYQPAYRDGLRQAEQLSRKRFGATLTALGPAPRLEVAKSLEGQNRSFFAMLRDHTMQGYYGSPRHGGNRDAVSWRMLGLDEPPVRGRAQYDLTAGVKP